MSDLGWEEDFEADPWLHEVDEALRSAPLDAPPPALAMAVMQQVRALPRPAFRLRWIDWLVGLFWSGMVGLVFLVGSLVPAPIRHYFGLEGMYWIERIRLEPALPLAVIGGALLAAGGGLLIGWAWNRYLRGDFTP